MRIFIETFKTPDLRHSGNVIGCCVTDVKFVLKYFFGSRELSCVLLSQAAFLLPFDDN